MKGNGMSTSNNATDSNETKKAKRVLTPYEKLVNKIIKSKEKKFGLKYDKCEELPEYKAYRMFMGCSTYGEFRHKASFYGIPVLKRDDMFKWYQMFFEVKTDCIMMQENAPSKEGYVKNVPTSSDIWTSKQLKTLRDYVLNWENPFPKKVKKAK